LVAALDATRVEPRPAFVAELGRRIREEAASSADTAIIRTDDPREPVEIKFDDYLWQSDDSAAPTQRKRWIGVVAAVAATILVAVGVLAVAERDGEDVDPALSPSVTDPPTSSEPSVVQGNAAVPGEDVRQELSDVIAADAGLIAVGSSTTGIFTSPVQTYTSATVWTSVDGIEWSQKPHDTVLLARVNVQEMKSVIAGGPGFVAVGHLSQSDDFADPGHAAVVWSSVDGITWSVVPHDEAIFGGPGNQRLNDVAAGGPGLVAVGVDGGGYGRSVNAALWTSVDGITWSRIPHDEAVFDGARMHSVTVGGPGLVAVGSSGIGGENLDVLDPGEFDKNFATDAVVWTSVDGITWSRIPHDEAVFGGSGSQTMSKVIAAGPGLVAVGSDETDDDADAAVWTSVDGITWSRVPHDEAVFGGPSTQEMSSVAVGGPGLVAVGSDGLRDDEGWSEEEEGNNVNAAVWTSVDGVTWFRVPHDRDVFGGDGDQYMAGVAAQGRRLVAVGTVGIHGYRDGTAEFAVWMSTDGITWARTAPPPEESNAASSLTTLRPSTTID
jgi:hypothetical protein